jgi:hypothetical protein
MPQPVKRPKFICPECRSAYLSYDIKHDDYYCFPCDISFTVLSTETDHVLYDGGPPKRTEWRPFARGEYGDAKP